MNYQNQQNQRQGFSCWTFIYIFLAINLISNLFGSQSKPEQTVRPNDFIIENALKPGDDITLQISIKNGSYVLYQTEQHVKYSLSEQPTTVEFMLQNITEINENLTISVKGFYFSQHPPSPLFVNKDANLTAYKRINRHIHETFNISKTTMLPKDFNIILVYSDQKYTRYTLPVAFGYEHFAFEQKHYFLTPIDMSQMHLGRHHYEPPNGNNTIKLQIFSYSYQRYMMFAIFSDKRYALLEHNPYLKVLFDAYTIDYTLDYAKYMMFDNNPWIVILTIVLSYLYAFLSFLAIKNEVSYWKDIEKHQGLSFKVLWMNLFFNVVMVLYLIENDANKLTIYLSYANIAVSLWKIKKTTKFVFSSKFPFVRLDRFDWQNRYIEQHDQKAVNGLYYFLVPMFSCYLIYYLYNTKNIMPYRFILYTIVGFISIFYFVQMTPQLYINYKLKSVAHLPWRMLSYRFLTTIVDDFYALLVTMPWLRRIHFFMDDIIFVAYMYQRWIYPVDPNRKPYGSDDDKEKKTEEIQAGETKKDL